MLKILISVVKSIWTCLSHLEQLLITVIITVVVKRMKKV